MAEDLLMAVLEEVRSHWCRIPRQLLHTQDQKVSSTALGPGTQGYQQCESWDGSHELFAVTLWVVFIILKRWGRQAKDPETWFTNSQHRQRSEKGKSCFRWSSSKDPHSQSPPRLPLLQTAGRFFIDPTSWGLPSQHAGQRRDPEQRKNTHFIPCKGQI